MQDAQDQQRFSFNLVFVGKNGNHRQSAILCRRTYLENFHLST
jgi:hypothetical protein